MEWIIGGTRAVDQDCPPRTAPRTAAAAASNTLQRVRPEQQRLRDDERLRILGQELDAELVYQATSSQAGRTAQAVARSQANSVALRAEIARIQPARAPTAAAGALPAH